MKTFLKRLIPETSPVRLMWHRTKAVIAAIRYGFPARKLTVIGVTGTDGKTTTVGMIAHILNANGKKTGAISTAFFQIGNEIRWNPTQKTSPSPFFIQKFLRELVEANCTHAVVECSSHGLLQGRVNHINPSVAAITNISEEHLDYHGTMENYMDAKSILFRMLKGKGTKVINADDRTYTKLLKIPTERTIHTSVRRSFEAPKNPSESAYWLTDISATQQLCSSVLHSSSSNQTWKLVMPIVGNFNLYNALTALSCVRGLPNPLSIESIVSSLAQFPGVPGRMERIDGGQDFTVIVDFTVTPKSYESTLTTLKAMLAPGKRLLAICGSCGDRMKEKRPIIGKIISNLADITVVTNEDPYTEDPEQIIDQVWAGIDQSKTEAHRIFDRLEAIRFLLNEAKTGDIVALCGKGADITMMLKNGQVPWNEREIVREELKRSEKWKVESGK